MGDGSVVSEITRSSVKILNPLDLKDADARELLALLAQEARIQTEALLLLIEKESGEHFTRTDLIERVEENPVE